jgi:NAD(P)-dependent dehydrogenase (short-subunit alcohol dehydrogenase family)
LRSKKISGLTPRPKCSETLSTLHQPRGSNRCARDWSRPLQPPAAQRFVGKNAVVTGSRMGVGFVIARTLAAEGANVCLVDLRDASDAVGVISADGGPGSITQVQCDITDESQVVAMAAEVSEIFGGECDVLINNAGYNGKCQLVRDMKLEDWEFTMKVNLTGTMLVTRELIPLLESGGGGGGKICNLASNVARRGLPYRADYVAPSGRSLALRRPWRTSLSTRE